jgi:hypothetical protein
MPERAKLIDGRLIFRLWISPVTRLVDKATVGDQRRAQSPDDGRLRSRAAWGYGRKKLRKGGAKPLKSLARANLRADLPGSPSSLREAILAHILARKAFCPQKSALFRLQT